jgi:hypothetical protein
VVVPATPRGGGLRGTRAPLVLLAGLGASLGAVAVRDPHQAGAWGYCPFLLLTGRPCPFCGGLRAVNDVVHGDLPAAVASNLLVTLSLPLLVALVLVWAARRWRGTGEEPFPGVGARTTLAAVVVVGGFWLIRLLPMFAWLTPTDLLSR